MDVEPGLTVEGLLTLLNVKREYTAVAVNREITPKATYAAVTLSEGDKVEIVRTGKYSSMDVMREAHEASGTEIITVAVRRVSLPSGESILDYIDTKRYTLLPNTAGCYSADEAIRTCYLAREAGLGEMVKLEVIGDQRTLFPDVIGLLEATRTLAREGFTVMPYTNDDPIMAKTLQDAGAACVMPLGAPIGSGLGIRNPYNIKIILE